MAISENTKETIERLKSLDLKIATIEEIKILMSNFGGLLLFGIEVTPGGMVLRGRPNQENGYYYYEEDISYISDKKIIPKIGLGRGNRKGEAIFYGCLPQGPEEEEEHQLVSMIEAGLKEDDDETKTHSYDLTMGKWRITKPFSIIVITHDENYIKKNKKLASMQKAYEEFTNTSPDRKDDYLYVSKYIASEFSKIVNNGEEYLYKISIAFFEVVRELGVRGIAYPSVKGEGTAFNIAMEPDLVNKCLKLDKVAVWTLLMKGKRSLVYGSMVCLNYQEDGKFIYQESGESPSLMRKIFEGKIKVKGNP
jgi:hypothetical protein